ncbi:helix-turn-helix domain-containing protein [Janibacter melonis]|uniref:helix-turn-helix domain-containing protein n=1 Tax=Janibacter melonis TaxID=262209 RepID=UPI001967B8CD|nr:helix-turn-helix domain-containing protein [Janibacter melonis]
MRDVAERLSLTPKTIFRLIADGRLRAFKVGGQWRIDREDLGTFVYGEAAKECAASVNGLRDQAVDLADDPTLPDTREERKRDADPSMVHLWFDPSHEEGTYEMAKDWSHMFLFDVDCMNYGSRTCLDFAGTDEPMCSICSHWAGADCLELNDLDRALDDYGISANTILALIAKKVIPAQRNGDRLMFHMGDIHQVIDVPRLGRATRADR